ncbi:hypothetical protein BDM02DRAFT_3192667 [Thelephora ganbajun]|uniref:Uncharacterized protein n=1 Tax=Thelephora ganbajun TaxID=370292 RepID=A0ACB6YZX2_THEGA|nr:hypothetical protein BDM02DRAFT_3192667 [Thelephora ganbajun]
MSNKNLENAVVVLLGEVNHLCHIAAGTTAVVENHCVALAELQGVTNDYMDLVEDEQRKHKELKHKLVRAELRIGELMMEVEVTRCRCQCGDKGNREYPISEEVEMEIEAISEALAEDEHLDQVEHVEEQWPLRWSRRINPDPQEMQPSG